MLGVELSTTSYIHEGLAFSVDGVGTIPANTATTFLGRIGDLPIHFHGFEVSSSLGPITIELIEAPAVSNAGTPIISYNKNRLSDNKSTMKAYSGATITGGTVIGTRKIHAIGGGSLTQGGEASFDTEWVLAPNKDYAFRITNGDTNTAASFAVKFFYYELEL